MDQLALIFDQQRRHDVFISFRGLDTRKNFTGLLYHALADAGIRTFKDNEALLGGEEISPGLIEAIRGSRVSVVVFSPRYAGSGWCLEELAEIMDCRKTRGQLVLPVFYGVHPFHFLAQSCGFLEAFAEHEERLGSGKVIRWREAFIGAERLKGFDVNGSDEALLIKQIIHCISSKLNYQSLHEAKFPVGLDSYSPDEYPSLSTGLKKWRYDVFVSYRFPDTRRKFYSHLRQAFTDAGIQMFLDEEELLGEEFLQGLLPAIRNSRISLTILSKNYAQSSWCLDELAEMMDWRKMTGQLILPIFYHVDPSDVRNMRGGFAKAFAEHEQAFMEKEKVARWRAAFKEAGSLSGWVVGDSADGGDEAGTIVKIVRSISIALNDQTHLHVPLFPVGLASCLPDINFLLSAGLGGVRFVGILGMGGIGKTTLAKAIYNQLIHHFEGKTFLADVRKNTEEPRDVIRLQEQLLRDTLKFKRVEVKVSSIHHGINIIRKQLRNKRVLVVLDDVSDPEQLRAFAEREWFGSGSRIIVTTRYLDLLNVIKADSIHKVKPLNDAHSLQLFCCNAFGQSYPRKEFTELSKEIVSYSKGVPLALEALGGSLRGKSVDECEATLQKLKVIPNQRIQAQLRISFDALGRDDKVQELFLDIACFFVGYDKDYALLILEACGLFAKTGICDLINRCLVEVDSLNRLQMHDLIRDMGREIVREQSPNNPGKRSRLWLHEDILPTLRSRLGTEEVEGIALNSSESDMVDVDAEAFITMKRLRLLKLNNVHFHGEYALISQELRWLCWHNFSLEFIPNDFYLGHLVALDLQYSNLREAWKNSRLLAYLKVLNLSHSHFLTKTPDFINLPNIEELIFEDCVELVDVHPSIGYLERLVLGNFKDCRKLKRFPNGICRVKSLSVLNITGCLAIEKLPEGLGRMESLTKFLADGLAIAEVPSSISCLKNLTDLSLCSCRTSIPHSNHMLITSLSGLSSLKSLKLMDCDLLNKTIPADIGTLQSLEDLDLRKNNFYSLPDTIRHLTKLKNLQLDGCRNLEFLPDMPPSLFFLSAVDCASLDRISVPEFGSGMVLLLTMCSKLRMVCGLDEHVPDGSIHLEQCSNLTAEFKEFLIKDWCGNGRGSVFLPGSNIPDWFDHQMTGLSLSFAVPQSQGSKLKGFTVCVIYSSNTGNEALRLFPSVHIEPLDISFPAACYANVAITPDDHMWVFYMPDSEIGDRLECVDEVKLRADFGEGWNVKGLGVHFGRTNITSDKFDRSSYMPQARVNRKRHHV